MAPVVPALRRDDLVQIGVGKDDARVLPHGAAQVHDPPGARHHAIDERKTRPAGWVLAVLSSNRAKRLCYRVQLTVLLATTNNRLPKFDTEYRNVNTLGACTRLQVTSTNKYWLVPTWYRDCPFPKM